MTIEADFVTIDPVAEKFIFDDGLELPFILLDSFYAEESDSVPKEILFEYIFTIKSIFEESKAKYSSVFGNVAFIDCRYVLTTLLESIRGEI